MKEKKLQIPKLLLALRIVASVLLAAGVALLIAGILKKVPDMGSDGWFDAESAKSGLLFGGGSCLMFGCFTMVSGFMPAIGKSMSKVSIQTTNEILEENKQELKEIADAQAEISKGAIKTTAKALKEGLTNTMYCKSCGKEIAEDSKYCKYCGAKQ